MTDDMERFRLTPDQLKEIHEAARKRLEKMSPDERAALAEADEADALREALSDDQIEPIFADHLPGTEKTRKLWGKS